MLSIENKLKRNIPKLYVFRFLLNLHFFAGILIPFFTEWGHISFAQVMLLQSWFVLWIFLMEVPTGAIADHFGRKVSLMCGAIGVAIAVLIYTSYPDFRLFLVAEFLWALSWACLSGADRALAYDSLKAIGQESSSKKIFARLGSVEMGAIMIAAPVGSILAARFGLRLPFQCMAIPFVAAIFVAASMNEPPKSTDEHKKYVQLVFSGIRQLRQHRPLRMLALSSTSINAFSFMILWMSQLLLKDVGVPLGFFGIATSLYTAAQILVMNQFDRLERWSGGKRNYLLLSGIIPGVMYVVLSIAHQQVVVVASVVVLTGFGLSRSVLINNYMNKHIQSSHRATVLSTVSMIGQLFGMIINPLIGYMAERSLRGTFLILGIAILLCSLYTQTDEEHLIE